MTKSKYTLYFDDWLDAAYMAREFDIKIQTSPTGKCLQWHEIIELAPKMGDCKWYVHDASQPIFYPNFQTDVLLVIDEGDGDRSVIMQRHFRPFFMPKEQKHLVH